MLTLSARTESGAAAQNSAPLSCLSLAMISARWLAVSRVPGVDVQDPLCSGFTCARIPFSSFTFKPPHPEAYVHCGVIHIVLA